MHQWNSINLGGTGAIFSNFLVVYIKLFPLWSRLLSIMLVPRACIINVPKYILIAFDC